MSPILVRPVREQLEHDRVIRLLQAKYKRKFEVGINPGNEQTTPVGTPPAVWYPDLVLQSTERTHKLLGTVEVETAESINNLEAMSQWATFSRLRAPFHLYIPAACVDSARRLCTDLQIPVAEVWAYHAVGDQMRFTLVHKTPQPSDGKAAKTNGTAEPAAPRPRPAAARPAAATPARPAPAARPAAAAARPAVARAAARSARPAAPPTRRNGAAATVSRKASAKAKAAPPRRGVAKPAARKTASSASRAQKRR